MQWIAENVTTALSFADKSNSVAQEATVFSLIYGTPLLSYSHLASKMGENLGEFATNVFYHQKKLASAGFNDINRPNVDTLYSEALIDLSSQELVVTIPKDFPTDRFYVFPFYDVYGNNVVNLGTVGVSSAAGKYLVSYRPADPGYGPSDGSDGYVGYIYMPTPYGAIDLRIQVNGSDDVPKVRVLQNLFKLTSTPIPIQLAPTLTLSLLSDGLSDNVPEEILQLTARLSLFCLPEVGSDIARVTSILRLAGLSRGSYATPSGVDLKSAAEEAIKKVASVLHSQFDKYFRNLGNSWSQLRDIYSGDFKTNYQVRAFVAAQGYLQLKAHQAIYPIYKTTSPLTSDKSYTVTFSRKPPVKGFWSLTVYNTKAYLIENQWNIYSLGDRSDIKYPNGDLVYGSGSDSDGEFTILLQTLDIPPPESYQSNWIPTPSQQGDEASRRFNFNLRWYGPKAELLLPEGASGAYVYPIVTALDAPVTSTSKV